MNAKQFAYTRINELNKEARDIRASDFNRANIVSRQAIELSNTIDYNKGKAEGLRTLGFSCIRVFKHSEALQYLEESLHLFESLNAVTVTTRALKLTGGCPGISIVVKDKGNGLQQKCC